MGKKTGFIDYPRTNFSYLPVQARLKNFKEFTKIQPKTEVQNQAARCMDCGTPYCSWACPVDNKMPEFNDFVYRGLWQKAYENLTSTNNFPEFTGRICPAPCESLVFIALDCQLFRLPSQRNSICKKINLDKDFLESIIVLEGVLKFFEVTR